MEIMVDNGEWNMMQIKIPYEFYISSFYPSCSSMAGYNLAEPYLERCPERP